MKLNKIYCGDCLKVMQKIDSESIDMILCDLPYGTTRCKWDSILPLKILWGQYERIIKEGGAIVLTASQPFTTQLIMSNFDNFKYCWYWDKKFAGNFVQAKRMPLKTVEDILVFSYGGKHPKYFPQMIIRNVPIKSGGNKQTEAIPIARTKRSKLFSKTGKVYVKKNPVTLLHFNVRVGRGLHPTQKPVALFKYLIKTYTRPNDIVLDNCAGSGTTGLACANLNRRFILIEKELKYCQIAQERIGKNITNIIYWRERK